MKPTQRLYFSHRLLKYMTSLTPTAAVYFANTLALTPFPQRIGSIYGSGLFWCKGDDILWEDLLLTTTS